MLVCSARTSLSSFLTFDNAHSLNYRKNPKHWDIGKIAVIILKLEPHHLKMCLRDFRPGKIQTILLSFRS